MRCLRFELQTHVNDDVTLNWPSTPPPQALSGKQGSQFLVCNPILSKKNNYEKTVGVNVNPKSWKIDPRNELQSKLQAEQYRIKASILFDLYPVLRNSKVSKLLIDSIALSTSHD